MAETILTNKRIILGVTGSIACYKVVDLASKLTQAGALVDVILTDSAEKFVSALSFRSVTGRMVYDDMWRMEGHVRHVELGENADLLVVVPATAHTMAKLAQGLADNLLTVTALAARCPILLAPAMDGGMFEHPSTQNNLKTLLERGAYVAGPAEGRMASGLIGKGRLLETPELMGHIRLILGKTGPLSGRSVVVTAGPTQEPLDPVRFLSNHSSGKQGIALAQAALDAGADVTLITGPVHQPIPVGARQVAVQTAEQMRDAVLESVDTADMLLMAAAVADFRPATRADQKIKKQGAPEEMSIPLVRNADILASVKARREMVGRPRLVLGFAAETENVLDYGRDKLIRKGLDFIAINDVSRDNTGFGVDTNQIVLLSPAGVVAELPLQSKSEIARQIVFHLVQASGD